MAFDLSALSTYTEEHAEEFFSKSVLKSKTAGLMNTLSGYKPGVHKIPDWNHDYDLFQSGTNCGFNASGDFNIQQRSVTVTSLTIQTDYCVRDLEAYFTKKILPAGQSYEGLGPVSNGLLSELSKAVGKMTELSIWRGESGGSSLLASENLFDGLDKIIDTEKTGGGIPAAQALTSGALTTSNIVAAVEDMYQALPIDVFTSIDDDSDWVCLMGTDKVKMYERGYRDNLGTVVYNQGFDKRFVDGTNIEIVGVGGLYGTDKIVLARRSNLIMALDVDGEEMDFEVGMDQYNEKVWVKARFAWGFQIHFPSEVVVNNY